MWFQSDTPTFLKWLLWNVWNSPRSRIIIPLVLGFKYYHLRQWNPHVHQPLLFCSHVTCPDGRSPLLCIMPTGISIQYSWHIKSPLFSHWITQLRMLDALLFSISWVWSAFQARISALVSCAFVRRRGIVPWDIIIKTTEVVPEPSVATHTSQMFNKCLMWVLTYPVHIRLLGAAFWVCQHWWCEWNSSRNTPVSAVCITCKLSTMFRLSNFFSRKTL